MGKSIPVVVGDRSFGSKGQAHEHFKTMLQRYRPGERVNSADADELHNLLKRHTEAADKIGVGVDHFEVMAADFGTKCFKVVRSDGSSDDFSYIHCITPKI